MMKKKENIKLSRFITNLMCKVKEYSIDFSNHVYGEINAILKQ
ncbi:hypothetical protein SDC9_208746 [bioreactor metagenome]|uniref:Uncharacterized protein n=1 Tax=bioreactor metagenome TaxID=1076179 RepID=A0A645JCW7_9ZZZZ